MKPSVLLTGGAGFIGSHVAAAYVAAGYAVTILDDLSAGRREQVPAGARLVVGDVRSREARDLVAEGGFTLLNHHAAQIDVQRSVADPLSDASMNVLGLLNLLQGARDGGVRRVILASSGGAIYGDGALLPTQEAATKLPASPYGVAKLASEYYLATFAQLYEIETVALRYSNVYGPRQRSDGEGGVVAVFSGRAHLGEPLTVYGDGEQTRDLVYVEDVAAANLAASQCAAVRPTSVDCCAYNIGTGVETSVNQLASLIHQSVRHAGTITHAAARAGEIRRSALSPEKAQRDLGWWPRHSIRDGVRATVNWLAAASHHQRRETTSSRVSA